MTAPQALSFIHHKSDPVEETLSAMALVVASLNRLESATDERIVRLDTMLAEFAQSISKLEA